jgi:uncharacterized tellurite resistance protein B-like protein
MENQETHLLSNYSSQEKTAYLGAIASITSIDKEASEEEVEFLKALTESADLSPNEEAEVMRAARDASNMELQHNLDLLKNSELRFSLITDIISYAKADGKFSPQEEAAIREISQYLGINQPQFQALSQVVDKADQMQVASQPGGINSFFNSSGIGDTLKKVGISPNTLMTGALGLLAPLVISRMFQRRGRSTGGGGMLGGLLGGVLGGAMTGGMNRRMGGGGLGSIFSMLSGGRGYGGMGSVLGNILSGRRSSF